MARKLVHLCVDAEIGANGEQPLTRNEPKVMTAVVERLDGHRSQEGRRSPCHPQPFTLPSFCRRFWQFP
jgi:hypothetical protein